MNHLNIFVAGVPMVSVPIATPRAENAIHKIQTHMPTPHVIVAIEDFKRAVKV